MQALPLDNLNSWWSFAALHGEYITDPSFPGLGSLAFTARDSHNSATAAEHSG